MPDLGEAAWQRIEAKYLIEPELADRLLDYCRSNLLVDPYSAKHTDYQYPIHSVYLDSVDGELLRTTLNAQPSRLKLRVRTYRSHTGSDEGLPSFFEVKRKNYGVVFKSRAMLPRAEADDLLWNGIAPSFKGHEPGVHQDTSHLSEFVVLREKIQAMPVVSVFYTREAYYTDTLDKLRISFDRNLHYGVFEAGKFRPTEMWWPVDLRGVILEIKFSNTFPFWVKNIIGQSELVRRGICKFAMCSRSISGINVDVGESQLL